MPCEKCNSQFTVFKRKKSCSECRRFYCNKCVSTERSSVICERCIIFTKRPLLRSDLLQLKPKDLIFYLQSKHISTAGCLEKEELVGLVLSHAQLVDAEARRTENGSPRSENDPFKSFDNIRHTCQNFFSNISDNFSESLAAFENRANTATTDSQQRQHQNGPTNISPTIFTQPRTGNNRPGDIGNWQRQETHQQNQQPRSNCKNNCSSPTTCVCSTTSSSISRENSYQTNNQSNNGTTRVVIQDELPGPSTLRIHSDHSKSTNPRNNKEVFGTCDDSSQSSFEELGAIGGVSDESKTATDTNSIIDQWQILDPQRIDEDDENIKIIQKRKILHENPSESTIRTTQAFKFGKIQRRNSDSVLETLRQNNLYENVSLLAITTDDTCLHARRHSKHITSQQAQEIQQCENRRGSKCKIRQQIKKLRNNLQNTQVSEADMKSDLNEFLTYLETRTKFLEHSDSEASTRDAGAQELSVVRQESEDMVDDDVGINVYATPQHQSYRDSRLNLESIDDPKELEDLSVKQLKEILMLNRVDYRGCCEKKELLDRVARLWRELKETPSSNKLKADELCKICMDAPIECIILECGHMATCTNCGKILSECPICRQYIVRVVRFFRA